MLPAVAGWQLQNRFVGDWLLWGGPRAGWRDAPSAWALRYASGDAAQPLAPGHGVERIEALGRDAVLIGNAGADLHFSAVRLARGAAQLAGRHAQLGAAQGESRTHGFFYRAQADDEGLLGLPTLRAGDGRRGGVYAHAQGAASVLFLRNRRLQFTALGALDAGDDRAQRDDACKASCVDWYGNARPVFLGERVFALMGYELVEGRIEADAWRWAKPTSCRPSGCSSAGASASRRCRRGAKGATRRSVDIDSESIGVDAVAFGLRGDGRFAREAA